MLVIKRALRLGFSTISKLSPVYASKLIFFKTFKRPLNLTYPQTFNEKLMWLKLFEDSTLKTMCTDKFKVRNYIQSLGLGEHLIPVLQVANHVSELSFEQLPKQFVIKCTHGSGYNIICMDKKVLDYEQTRRQLAKWMQLDFSLLNCEPHYAKIQPRIVVEQFLGEVNGKVPVDYKIHCFHGEPKIIELIIDRYTSQQKSIMLTQDWDYLDYMPHEPSIVETIQKPKKLEQMLAISKTLSKLFTYVRVDLYYVADKIYFGELTFTPAACLDKEFHEEADRKIGKLIELPQKQQSETTYRSILKNLLRKTYS